MRKFKIVSTAAFDAALKAMHVRDEHDYLESRFFDEHDEVFARVGRYLDGEGELKPEADLMLVEKGRPP